MVAFLLAVLLRLMLCLEAQCCMSMHLSLMDSLAQFLLPVSSILHLRGRLGLRFCIVLLLRCTSQSICLVGLPGLPVLAVRSPGLICIFLGSILCTRQARQGLVELLLKSLESKLQIRKHCNQIQLLGSSISTMVPEDNQDLNFARQGIVA